MDENIYKAIQTIMKKSIHLKTFWHIKYIYMIQKIKEKGIGRVYADLIKCWNTGYGAVLGRWAGIVNLALLGSIYLLVKGFELSFTQTIFFIVFVFLSMSTIGFLYLKMGLQKQEFSSNFTEQPEFLEMYNRLRSIEEKIDKITGDMNGKSE